MSMSAPRASTRPGFASRASNRPATPDATVEESAPPALARRGPSFLQKLWRDRLLVLFILPGFLVLLVFHYYPLLGNVIAFKNFRPYPGVWGATG